MHFLAPLWLGALAALALPLALHLLSRGRGRRVPLASTRLLESALSVRGRRLKPSDLALLALRAACLAAVALALAEPWIDAAPVHTAASWLLVEPGSVAPREPVAARTLADWRRDARATRFLAPGLPEADPGPQPGSVDAWSLLAEADRLAPDGVELRVATRGRLAELRGWRPLLAHRVVWLDGAAGEVTAGPRLLAAGPATATAVGALVARSGPEAVAIERTSVPLDGAAGGLAAERAGERIRVYDRTGQALTVAAGAGIGAAWRAEPARAGDAETWRRACDAGAAAVGATLAWSEAPASAALRIWLDDAAPSPLWADPPGFLVTEASGPGVPCAERAAIDGETVAVTRCEDLAGGSEAGIGPASSPEPMWNTGTGRGLLFERPGSRAHLATRVGAAWSDLSAHSALPRLCARWIEALLAERSAVARLPVDDARLAAADQRAPGSAPVPVGAPSAARRDASGGLWLAVAVLLAGERLVTRRVR